MIFRFVWNRKCDRISRDTAVKHIADGGLGYSSNKKLYECSKVNMDKKLKTTNHRWKQIACQMYQDMDNTHVWSKHLQ